MALRCMEEFASVSKRVLVRNLNEFDLHENEQASKTHCQVKGYALGLVLKLRDKELRLNGLLDNLSCKYMQKIVKRRKFN